MRFDHLLYERLDDIKSNGAFLGEAHNAPALREALTFLMPALKAHNVTTLSLELPQSIVNDMLKASTVEEWRTTPYATLLPKEYKPEEYYYLVKAAQKYGITVLGHEDEAFSIAFIAKAMEAAKKYIPSQAKIVSEHMAKAENAHIFDAYMRAYLEVDKIIEAETKKNPNLGKQIDEYTHDFAPHTHKNMHIRNKFAKEYIDKNKYVDENGNPVGKTLVIGGIAHGFFSHNADCTDHPVPSMSSPESGLDALLNLSAINYKEYEIISAGTIGTANELSKGDNTYETLFPADLKNYIREHGITSWPPLGMQSSLLPPSIPFTKQINQDRDSLGKINLDRSRLN